MISFPSSTTFPFFKSSIPSIAFIAVDLPAPLGPRMDTISPLLTLKEHSSIMFTPPYPPVKFEAEKNIIFLIPYLNKTQ